MPAIGANGGIQRGARLPGSAAPKVAAPPPSVPRSALPALANRIGSSPTAPRQAPVPNVPKAAVPALRNRIGVAQSKVPSHPEPYAQAVIDIFRHQSPTLKTAIVQGAIKNPSPEGKLILDYVKRIGSGPLGGSNLAAIQAPQGLASAAIRGTTGVSHGILKVLQNAATDVWNLPAGTVEGLYGLGKQGFEGANAIASGNVSGGLSHFGSAAHMLADPYVQLAEHPLRTLEQHPVNSALMVGGVESLLGKGAGAIARSGALGDARAAAASTAREPLSLGTAAGSPVPIHEERSYSPDLIKQSMQKARESYVRARGRNPNVASPKPKYVHSAIAHAFNVGQEAKLNRIVDEMTAVRQMAGRGERATVLAALHKAAPHKDVRNITSHILQGVVRTPETAVADITKEIDRLKAAQTGKRTTHEIFNRRQVRDLGTALQHPEKIPEAFQAAEKIRGQIHAQDSYLVAHGLLDPAQAARRAALPYAMAHMGAHYDPVAQRFVTATGEHMPTEDILQHLKDNGVPEPAYVRHAAGRLSNPGDFYKAYKLARGGTYRGPLTGRLFQTGGYDHSFEGLAGQMASRAEDVTRASLHDKVISRLGVRMPQEMRNELLTKTRDPKQRELIRQGLLTKDEANKIANAALHEDNGNKVPGALELTPISVASAHALGLVKDLQKPGALDHLSEIEHRALANAIDQAQHSTTRNVVLIPSVAAHRFSQQFAHTDSMLRSVGRVTQQFRRTVLPYSTHWMLQIGSEAGLRALIAGALDPRYLRDGRALMKRLKQTEAGRAAGM
jgi:hypothetical protein